MNKPLPEIFAALSDPTRFAIIEQLLTEKTMTIGDLSQPFDMSAPAISRHIKILEEAGLIERRIEKQWRVCSLRRECFSSIEGWLRQYRDYWSANLDGLEKFLSETEENEG